MSLYNDIMVRVFGEDAVASTTTANIPVQPVVQPNVAKKYKERNAQKAEETTNIVTLVPRIVPSQTLAEEPIQHKTFMEHLLLVMKNDNMES